MSDELPASVVYLQSEGTPEDFEEFWRKDPIGAAQFATGIAMAEQKDFEGIEELKQLLDETELSPDEQKKRLVEFGKRSRALFEFVESSERARNAKPGEIGWTTS